MSYLQLFSWHAFEMDELKRRLLHDQPDLIEWISPEEVSIEQRPEYNILVKYLDSNPLATMRVLVPTPDVDRYSEHQRIEYEGYPIAFFRQAVDCLRDNEYLRSRNLNPHAEYQDLDFKYKFASFNHKSHEFRCKMIDQFALHGLINDSNLITWNNVGNSGYQFKHFTPRRIVLEDDNWYAPNGSFDSYKLPVEYGQFAFSAIAESSIDQIFITEKTIIPMWFYKPFIILGGRGFNHYLKECGFELFEELFDYSFDLEQDKDKRINGFAEQVKRLDSMSISEITALRNSLKDRLIHNNLRAKNIIHDRKFWPRKVTDWVKHQGDYSVVVSPSNVQDGWLFKTSHMSYEFLTGK